VTRWCALVLALAAQTARADPPLVRIEVTASAQVQNASGAFAPINAVDDKTSTAWCAPDAGASLTLTFDHPLPVQRIAIRTGGGPADKRAGVDQLVITTSDGRTMRVARSDQFVQAIGGRPIGSLSIAFAAVRGDPGAYACIRDVELNRDDRTAYALFVGTKAALAALRPSLVALRGAFTRCNAKQLAGVVRFPFERLARPSRFTFEPDVIRIGTATELAAECRDNKRAWNIGGTLEEDLAETHFLDDRVAFVAWDVKWWLEWDGKRWVLTSVD
jgi:hypothetical protein